MLQLLNILDLTVRIYQGALPGVNAKLHIFANQSRFTNKLHLHNFYGIHIIIANST